MPNNGAVERPYADGDRYEELRALLLGPEREMLDSLQERLDNPKRRAEDVAGVLAEAIRLRSDVKLRRALQPLLQESLEISVRTNPRVLAEALFPIFGQAIRKSIRAELEQMLETLSQSMEQRVSLRSIEWRLEAMRSRKPYAEIVLLRSLLYRVEQVFLIHRKTGLLLRHVAADELDAKDPEMVSGMLTAIQDFVHDSVKGSEGDSLDVVKVGEIRVVLAYSSDAILCGFVRGVPPSSLGRLFQDKLDEIEREKAEALVRFSGDTEEFASCQPQLEACLLGQGTAVKHQGGVRMARLLLFGVPVLLLLGLAAWWVYSAVMERRFQALTERVAAQPGIVVTQAQRRDGQFVVSGLRDPLAPNPGALVSSAGLPASQVKFEWQDYHSLEPGFANERAFEDLRSELEGRGFRFGTGAAEIPPEQRFLLEDVAAKIIKLLHAAEVVHKTPLITVVGNHDPIGSEQLNSGLAMARAENVRAALISVGVPAARLAAEVADREHETCSAVKEEERFECRSAVFRVSEKQTP